MQQIAAAAAAAAATVVKGERKKEENARTETRVNFRGYLVAKYVRRCTSQIPQVPVHVVFCYAYLDISDIFTTPL